MFELQEDEMGWSCSIYWARVEMHKILWLEDLKDSCHSEDIWVYGRIILKRINWLTWIISFFEVFSSITLSSTISSYRSGGPKHGRFLLSLIHVWGPLGLCGATPPAHWLCCSLSFLTWSSPLSSMVHPSLYTVRPIPISPTIFPPRLFFIALMMEAVRTSVTSVYFNETTRRCIPA
jgi:hypothetical protein